MQIRKAIIADKEQLAKLLIEFNNFAQKSLSKKQSQFRAYKDLLLMAEENSEKYINNPEYFAFVADKGKILKGFIFGEIIEREYRVYYKEGYVRSWFVEEEYQNQGIGKQLFDALTEEFKKNGCTHVGLDTNVENAKAIQIYEHMGFIKRLVTFIKPLQDLS